MASNTDKMRQGASNISTTLQTSISNSDTSLTPASIANIPTITAVDISIDRVDSSGALTPSKWERCIGVVSGGNIVSILRGQDGSTAVPHSTGAVIEMMPTGKWSQDLVAALLVQHNQDGTHSNVTATSVTATTGTFTNLTISGTATSAGWSPLGSTPNTVTCNGNRSYSLVFNGTDLTSTLSPGMRLKTARTVAAPTQCTSLNGTNQYYSKSSPAAMTFTDDFTISAYIKTTGYTSSPQVIASRYNGTSGWVMYMESTGGGGGISIMGVNGGASNIVRMTAGAAVPLNKWVHVSAQLDMSSYPTVSPTTNYVMYDGVDVLGAMSRGGTNPTALVQAGNLEIGSWNGGLLPFGGKIAQVAIFNAKVTQATMQGYISQGLSGTETSLISAYSFNNSINDLNTTNANNLTANNGAVATNADSPFGGQAGGTNSSTIDYGIVQSATFSTNTTVVVQVPDGCTIPTSGGVSTVSYSTHKSPFGFPANLDKWEISFVKSPTGTSSSSTTFVNVDGSQITVPIGSWLLNPQLAIQTADTDLYAGLSTSSTAATNAKLTARLYHNPTTLKLQTISLQDTVSLSAATTYYVVGHGSGSTFAFRGVIDDTAYYTVVTARNTYV